MTTNTVIKYHLEVFWDDEYKDLTYENEPFNDVASTAQWIGQGYWPKFTGDMCDMRSPQPSWNDQFIKHFESLGWKDVSTSYYRMNTGTVLPMHSDLYVKYIDLFKLQGQEQTLRRAIVFLEEWKSGHYFESPGEALTGWSAGTVVEWVYDMPHLSLIHI